MSVTINGDTGVSAVQDGAIVQADLATAVIPLGVGQTWQNMTGIGGRASGASITNTSGRTIALAISPSALAALTIVVEGVTVCSVPSLSAGNIVGGNAIVPAGAVYTVTCTSIGTWAELR